MNCAEWIGRNGRRAAGCLLLVAVPFSAGAGAYIFAGEVNGPEVITHPTGYAGIGGNVEVNVCIVPGSPNAAAMEIPVQNVIDRYNLLVPTVGNLRLSPDGEVPFAEFDWESVLTHEIGHCIGLAHVNLATESGLSGADRDYTKTTDGVDDTFNLDSGVDTVRGSADDLRGDDVNLHWFFDGVNNPFILPATPQMGTYTRELADLPPGDIFVVNGDRTVATQFLPPMTPTEAVMQQGQPNGEDQRALTADGVATLQHARTGIDRTAGTVDDYTVTLNYGGISADASCDLNVSFDDTETGFAVCKTGGVFISLDGHVAITTANTFYNTTAVTWFYSSRRIPLPAVDAATVSIGGSTSMLDGGGTSLLANDVDQDGAGLLLSSVVAFEPAHGTVTLNAGAGGTFTYNHTDATADPDRFAYRVCVDNGAGGETAACSHQWVNVTVTGGNTAPTAVDDGPGGAFAVDEGAMVTLTAADLTGNDTDAEDGSPTGAVSIVGATSNGSMQDNGNQTFTFTHDDSETTSASFQYRVMDSGGLSSNTATVSLTVNPRNDPPLAADDGPGGAFAVDEGLTVTLSAADLTGNDTDAEDTEPSGVVTIVGTTSNGAVQDNGNQTFTFTHDDSETTAASFQYQVRDSGGLGSNFATVNLTVNPLNDPPVAIDDGPGSAFVVDEGSMVTLTAANLSGNDTDNEDTSPAGDLSVVGITSNGSVQDNGDQTFTFTHDGSETVGASFQYQVMDSGGLSSNTATVSLTVNPQNDPAVAVDDGPGGVFEVGAGQMVTLDAADLTSNDTDAEDGSPTGAVSIVGTTSNGSVQDNGDQTLTFTHDGNESTSATFQYQVMDSGGQSSNTATVTLTVNSQSNPPLAVCAPGGRRARVGLEITIETAGEFEGRPTSFEQSGLPASLAINMATGQIIGTPAAGDEAASPYAIVVTADDGPTQQTLTFMLTIDADSEVVFYSSYEATCIGL